MKPPTEFTGDQLDAIEYRKLDACVVAGPGAGKTTVLVERYRRLLDDHGFEPRQILAITFTEKAAANMKAKLAEKFAHDAERRRELESGWVSTIHGFCVRLLRENAIAAGLDPRFTVLSPRESDNLQWECLGTALDELTANRREETLELIDALQSPSLAGDLKDVYDGIRSAGMTIERVRAMGSPVLEEGAQVTPPDTAERVVPPMSGAVSGGSCAASPPVRIAAELRDLVREWPFDITPAQRAEKARLLEWCLDFDACGEVEFATFLELKERLKLNLNKVPPKFKEALKELRERVECATTAAVDRHAAPFRTMIFDVLERFDEAYRERKNALGRVDFNDLERYAIALLRGDAEVRQRVHAQFRQVMLDEFQDINGQQNELISLLCSGDVFFGVGDVNQSIYGFRHARPEIFCRYRDDVVFRAGHSVELLHNFRSRQAILHFVREILAGAEGIDDRDLVSGATFAAKDEASIEILEIRDAGDDKDASCAREAAWIAHRIRSLCGTLQLGPPGETRPADFRDFAVLCRNGDSMEPILAAFGRAGIPYVCGRRQSFLLSREGLDITALLSVISNPRDSIALATLLRSPLVGVSDEGLLRLRLLAGSLTSGLNKFAHAAAGALAIPEPDASRLARFCANLNRWREDQPVVPLDLLLSRALSDCGADWGANTLSFLQLARTTGVTMDLPAFLRELEGMADAADVESDLSDEDQGNCVRVMTTHGAKGLEFPVTIVAAMDKGARNESSPVTFTPEHGLGVKWRNPASKDIREGFREGLKDSWAEANSVVSGERESREENRLLYVATTRAAEHLILSWSRGKNKPSHWAKLIHGQFNMSSLPSSPSLPSLPSSPSLPSLPELPSSPEPCRVNRPGFDVSVLVTDADHPGFTQARTGSGDADVQIVARPVIGDRHETTVAVTSLAVFGACPRKYYIQRSLGWNSGRFRRFDPDDIANEDEDTADEEGDLPASRIGSAVHQILAGLPPADDVPEARQLADVFLRSDLGKRAAASLRSAREWSFIADIDGTILRGSIDLWFEENGANGELYLVDYKTDAVGAAAAPARALEYQPQLALYAMALERALGARPRLAWLHFLRPDTVVEVPLDDAAVADARSLIGRLRRAQDELRFDLNEGEHCHACQFYRSLCPAGRQGG